VALLVVLVLISCSAPVVADDDPELFPVSQAEGTWPSQDGENIYYDLAPHPDEDVNKTLVVPRGFNEMVVYYGNTFRALNLDLQPHFRAAEWHPSGEYSLVASGELFAPETGIYRYENRSISPVFRQRGGDTIDVSFNENGEALAVSFNTQPTLSATVLYSPDGEEFRNLRTPKETRIRSIDWSPNGERAAVVGQGGTILIYEDGQLRDESADTDAYFRDIEWKSNGAVIVGSGGTTTDGLPTEGGVVYEWNPEGGTEKVAETDHTLNGVAMKPDGEYSLIVGGDENGRLHRYNSDGIKEVGIEAGGKLWGVGWTDGKNALIVGDEEIWRYSYTEFTVRPENPTTEDTITLNGFGSTSGGSSDRIRRWRFEYGQQNPEWTESRRVEIRLPSPGEYELSLTVEDDEGERSETVEKTVAVQEASDTNGTDTADATDTDTQNREDASELPGFTPLLALIAIFVASVFRAYHQEV